MAETDKISLEELDDLLKDICLSFDNNYLKKEDDGGMDSFYVEKNLRMDRKIELLIYENQDLRKRLRVKKVELEDLEKRIKGLLISNIGVLTILVLIILILG